MEIKRVKCSTVNRTHMKILRASFICVFALFIRFSQAQDYDHVQYGPEDRQWLDIYIAPSECPTPVYFDAHGNGGNTNMPNRIVEALKEEGISTIAWESLTSVNTPTEVETGWDDAELMFNWVKENADFYNFDTTNFIIGGSSRGSILSWKYGHRPNPNIKGLYMYNALPDGVWADSSWWYPPNEIRSSSPPIFFVYKYEPGVLFDSHDPENGQIIMAKYDSLGIGDRDTLVHSIEYSDNNDKYQFLVDFARSITTSCQIVSTLSEEYQSPNYKAFPNPFQSRIGIQGLKGKENFFLSSIDGTLIRETANFDSLNWAALNAGVYFLTIQTKNYRKVLKLIKLR